MIIAAAGRTFPVHRDVFRAGFFDEQRRLKTPVFPRDHRTQRRHRAVAALKVQHRPGHALVFPIDHRPRHRDVMSERDRQFRRLAAREHELLLHVSIPLLADAEQVIPVAQSRALIDAIAH